MTNAEHLAPDEIWVLVERDGSTADEIAQLAGRRKISVERLGTMLNEFTAKLGKVLSEIKEIGHDFELSEVSVDANLSLDLGFELIGKVGLEGGVTLTFTRAANPEKASQPLPPGTASTPASSTAR